MEVAIFYISNNEEMKYHHFYFSLFDTISHWFLEYLPVTCMLYYQRKAFIAYEQAKQHVSEQMEISSQNSFVRGRASNNAPRRSPSNAYGLRDRPLSKQMMMTVSQHERLANHIANTRSHDIALPYYQEARETSMTRIESYRDGGRESEGVGSRPSLP